MVTILMHSITG